MSNVGANRRKQPVCFGKPEIKIFQETYYVLYYSGCKAVCYTNKTVIRVTREALCHAKHKKKHARPQRKRGMNRWLHHRRQEQKLVYFALFKVSSAKDKTKYIEESKQTAAKKTA